jgi:anti-anti-sigma factor
MKITKTIDYHSVTLFLEGWLDTQNVSVLAEESKKITPETKKVVLDMKKLDYISSAGLREIAALYKKLKEQDGILELVHLNDEVLDIFRMSGFDKKLTIK